MRSLITAAMCLSLATTSAMAGGTSLTPGKPAGVKNAQVSSTTLVIMVGIAGAIAAVAFGTASSGNPGQPVSPTTVPTTTAG
jgi:hypothetical protein